MNRDTNLARLDNEIFDLCIIGAGASGAGSALDAALRGLKVILVEKTDFAAETSSRSTKLIHGGVRYLEQAFKNLDFAQLKQVRHGLEERHIVLANAPHLARPLALVTPVFSWFEGLYFSAGLALYGWFASKKDTLPRSKWLSKRETLRRLPTLSPRMHSAVLYYDGQLDDARYCVALAQTAAEAGAVVVNHVAVTGFEKDANGRLTAAIGRDLLAQSGEQQEFTIRARAFLNCTGPYADHVRQMANPSAAERIRPSKGVHAVLPRSVLPSQDALLIPKTPDGRVVFVLPFEGQVVVGTTDNDFDDLNEEPALESREVDFLLETLQPYMADPLDRTQIKAGFGGLRPLIMAASAAQNGSTQSTKTLLRDHEVERDVESGLLSLLGGKWTTYRLMAKDAVDAACRQLGNSAPCRTDRHVLAGGEGYDFEDWRELSRDFNLPETSAQHLLRKYGSRAPQVAALAAEKPDLAQLLHPDYPFLRAEIVYAARFEMARTVRDFLARRIRLEIVDWQAAIAAAPIVANLLAGELDWSVERTAEATAEYTALVQHFQKQAFS